MAQETGADLVAVYGDAPLFSYDGVAHFSPDEREHYEDYVLPGFAGPVDWDNLLPWLN